MDAGKFAPLSGGLHADTSLTELSRWWLDHMVRHRVRVTTWSRYEKQLRIVNERLGDMPVRKLRPENVAGVIVKSHNRTPPRVPTASACCSAHVAKLDPADR